MNNIDSRIVEMQFDNKQFESGISDSIKSLEKLKESLNLKDAGSALSNLGKAAGNVALTPLKNGIQGVSMSLLDVAKNAAVFATVEKYVNRATDAVENLVKSMSIDQVSAGWSKYNDKVEGVQTIMAATGASIDVVNASLEKLQWFTDETSYGFNDMVSSIGKFTSAGLGLDESVNAMMGIANWAALSGTNAKTASSAYYNLSQAISAGALKLQDYKSIQNIGMDTQNFRKAAIEAAVAVGTLKEAGDGTWKTLDGANVSLTKFTESLSKGWLSTEVMMKTFGRFGSYSDEIYKISDGYDTCSEAMAAYTGEVDEMAMKSFKAAQEAKTFADAIDATKDAVSSGWMESFEIIFGNYEEAKVMWTDLANTLWDVFASGASGRNDFLREVTKGGWDRLTDGIKEAGGSVEKFETELEKVYKSMGEEAVLKNAIEEYGSLGQAAEAGALKTLYLHQALKNLEEGSEGIDLQQYLGMKREDNVFKDEVKEVQQALIDLDYQMESYGADGIFGPVTESALKAFQAAHKLEETGVIDQATIDKIKEVTASTYKFNGDLLELAKNVDTLGGRELVVQSLGNIFYWLCDVIGVVKQAFSTIFPPITAESVVNMIQRFHDFTETLSLSSQSAIRISRIFRGVFSVFDLLKTVITSIGSGFLQIVGHLSPLVEILTAIASKVGYAIITFRNWVRENQFIEKTIGGITNVITFLIDKIFEFGSAIANWGPIKAVVSGVSSAFSSGASAVADFVENVFSIPFDQFLINGFSNVYDKIIEATTAVRNWWNSLDAKKASGESLDLVDKIGIKIKDATSAVGEWITKFKQIPIVSSALSKLTGMFDKLHLFTMKLNVIFITFKKKLGTFADSTFSSTGEKIKAFAGIIGWLGVKLVSVLPFGDKVIDVIKRIRDAFSGGFEIIKGWWDSLFAGADKVEAKVGGMSRSIGKISESAKKIPVISDIFNTVRTAIEKVIAIGSKVKGIFDHFINRFKAINAISFDNIGDKVHAIWNVFTETFSNLGSLVPDILGDLTSAFENAKNTIINWFGSITDIPFADVFANAFTSVVDNIGNGIDAIREWWNSLGGKSKGLDGPRELSLFDTIALKIKNIVTLVGDWFTAFKSAPIVSTVLGGISTLFSGVTSIGGKVGDAFTSFIDKIREINGLSFDNIQDKVEAVKRAFSDFFSNIWSSVSNIDLLGYFSGLGDSFMGWLNSADGLFPDFRAGLSNVIETVTSFINKVKELPIVQSIMTGIHSAFSSLGDLGGKIGSNVLDFIDTLKGMGDAGLDTFGDKINYVKEALLNMFKNIGKTFTSIDIGAFFENAKQTFLGLFDSLKSKVPDIKDAFLDWVYSAEGAFPNLRAIIGSVIEKVQSLWDWFNNLGIVKAAGGTISSVMENLTAILSEAKKNVEQFFSVLFGDDSMPSKPMSRSMSKGAVKQAEEATSIIDRIKNAFASVDFTFIDKIKEGFTNVVDFFGSLKDRIVDVVGGFIATLGSFDPLKAIGDKFRDFFGNFDLKKTILDVGVIGAIIAGVVALKKLLYFVQFLKGASTGIALFLHSISKVSNSITSFVKTSKKMLVITSVARAFQMVAVGILVIAGAIALLASMEPSKMWGAVGALGAMTGAVLAILVILPLLQKFGKVQLKGASQAILSVCLGLALMVVALKLLETLDMDGIWSRLGLLALVLGATVALMFVVNKVSSATQGNGKNNIAGMFAVVGSVLVLVVALAILNQLDLGKTLVSVLAVVGLMAGLAYLFTALSKIDKDITAAGKTMVMLSSSILIIAVALKILSQLDPADIAKGIIAIGALMVLSLLMGKFSTSVDSGKNIGRSLLSMTAGILLMAVAIKIIGGMNPSEIAKGIITITLLSVLVTLMNKFGQNPADKVANGSKTILAMATAMLIMSVAMHLIGMMDFATIIVAASALSVLMLTFGAMAKMASKIETSLGTLFILAGIIAVLAAVLHSLAGMEWSGIAKGIVGMGGMIIIFGMLASVSNTVKGTDFKSVLPAILMLGLIVAAFYVLGSLDLGQIIAISGGITAVLVSITAAAAIVGTIPAMAINSACVGILKLVATLGLIIAAIVAIGMVINGLNAGESVLAAVDIMTEIIAKIIGSFFAAPFAGFAEGINMLIEPLEKLQKVTGAAEAAKNLAEAVLILTGASFLNAIGLFGTINFATTLVSFTALGEGIKTFSESVKDIDEGALKKTKTAAKVMKSVVDVMTSLPRSGGLVQKIVGEYDLKGFGDAMRNLATGLFAFGTTAKFNDFSSENVAAAIEVAKALAGLYEYLPKIGGLAGILGGNKDLAGFGDGIVNLAVGLGAFATTIGSSFSEKKEARYDKAVEIAQAIAGLYDYLPKVNGFAQALDGQKSLTNFATGVEALGGGLSAFAISVGGGLKSTDSTKYTKAVEIATAMAQLYEYLPKIGGFMQAITGFQSLTGLAVGISALGTGLSTFATEVGQNLRVMDYGKYDAAVSICQAMAGLYMFLPNTRSFLETVTGFNALEEFADGIAKLALGLSTFATELSDSDFDVNFFKYTAAVIIAQGMAMIYPILNNALDFLKAMNSDWVSLQGFELAIPNLCAGLSTFADEMGKSDFDVNVFKYLGAVAVANGIAMIYPTLNSALPFFQSMDDDWTSLENFATGITNLATGLNTFATTLSDTSGLEEGGTCDRAVSIIRGISRIWNNIVNSAVLDAMGEMHSNAGEFMKFTWSIPFLGFALKAFVATVDGVKFDSDNVNKAVEIAQSMSDMAAKLPKKETWGPLILDNVTGLDNLGSQMEKLGSGLSDFVDNVKDVSDDEMSVAEKAATTLCNIADTFNGAKGISEDLVGQYVRGITAASSSIQLMFDELATINVSEETERIAGILKLLGDFTTAMNATAITSDTSNLDFHEFTALGDAVTKLQETLNTQFTALAQVPTDNLTALTSAIGDLTAKLRDFITVSPEDITRVAESAKTALSSSTPTETPDMSGVTASMNQAASAGMSEVANTISSGLSGVDLSSSGLSIGSSLAHGIASSAGVISAAAKTAIKGASTAVSAASAEFTRVGENLSQGLAHGIGNRSALVAAAARAAVTNAVNAAKAAGDIHSPSRIMMLIGRFFTEGFAIGISNATGQAIDNATHMMNDVLSSTRGILSNIGSFIEEGIDADPTIRPVLDLSEVEAGAAGIGGLFGNQRLSVGTLGVGNIAASMSNLQNRATNADVVSAINGLKSDLANIQSNTYNVNGVTYDDGSNVVGAVESLVRAVRLERRA